MIDHLIRAESRSVWLTYAQDWGWIDEDDNPTSGILIDEIGPVVLMPAVLDEDMTIITPAVMDDWHHVNVRVLEDGEAKIATAFEANSKLSEMRGVTVIEKGVEPTRIQVLSSADIATPVRVWAGGMFFADPPRIATTPAKRKRKT